jgi:hypothetical protein
MMFRVAELQSGDSVVQMDDRKDWKMKVEWESVKSGEEGRKKTRGTGKFTGDLYPARGRGMILSER